jgi:glyoxylase-like metal-dependent hydrolase (beta-lactamase superfamily II)
MSSSAIEIAGTTQRMYRMPTRNKIQTRQFQPHRIAPHSPPGLRFSDDFPSADQVSTAPIPTCSRAVRAAQALIIDPVLEKVDRYLHLVHELDLKLVKAVDTHLHADHITGLGALRDHTHCITVMGEQTKADVVSMRLSDGDKLTIEGLALEAIYTPGHTDDSYSFVMPDRVFTGDTLLIRGTGRTDFQNGDARQQYESIFNRLLKLPETTLVYPAHDYKGDTVSTIGEEKAFNPRLQVKSVDEYVDLMNNLKLTNPKMMDIAVPANIKVGLAQEDGARLGGHGSAGA